MNFTETQITGGSCPMKISGQEFRAIPLTDKDDAELSEYVQFQMIDLARKYCKNQLSDERKEITQAAISASVGIKWNSSEGSRILSTSEGGARIGWQMIKNQHKNITFEEFKELCFKDKIQAQHNMDEIDRVFGKLNTVLESNGNGKQEVKDDSKNAST